VIAIRSDHGGSTRIPNFWFILLGAYYTSKCLIVWGGFMELWQPVDRCSNCSVVFGCHRWLGGGGTSGRCEPGDDNKLRPVFRPALWLGSSELVSWLENSHLLRRFSWLYTINPPFSVGIFNCHLLPVLRIFMWSSLSLDLGITGDVSTDFPRGTCWTRRSSLGIACSAALLMLGASVC